MTNVKKALKVITAVLAVSGIIYGSYAFLSGPIFKIRSIEIQLEDQASYSAIFPKIKEDLDFRLVQLFGDYIWKVDLEKVLQAVEKDLRIKEAKVTRVLPDKLQVYVHPHTPVANILGSKKKYLYPLARDGEVLPAVPIEESTDGPVLRGEKFIQDSELRMKTLKILTALPELGALSLRTASEILFNKNKGFQIIIHPSGAEVWLGFEDFSHRLSQAVRVVEYLENEELSGRIIDARFAKKVVVKLRNDP